MYPSPLRDGGYDIADFYSIHPDYGTVDDFHTFVDGAHERGMRVIADLVMNHTSSDHPWFQEARSSPDSPEARLVRVVRHRGSVHRRADHLRRHRAVQLDLGREGGCVLLAPVLLAPARPQLRQPRGPDEMLKVLEFWLDLGIDGFRLDAVPYLFERDGTNCENLAETHEYLKRLRASVDAHYPDRVLLAEANQWPEDVVEYFGDGDECHMAFHFPLMPRIFMALRREDAMPIIEILDRTPPIPDAPSGVCSCATTTSSRSRWSPTTSATTCTRSTPRTR